MNKKLEFDRIAQQFEWLKKVILKLDKHATLEREFPAQSEQGVDMIVKLNEHTLLIEYKKQIQPRDVEQLFNRSTDEMPQVSQLVVADYITPKAKNLLIERGISYLDQGGNISLRLPNYIIHFEGMESKSEQEKYHFRAFTKTGTRVVFQLLMNPEMINAPQRELANRAGVSLGTIPKVLKELLRDKYAVKLTEQSYELINKEKLLGRWVDAFNSRLLPSLVARNYSPVGSNVAGFFKEAKMAKDTVWGGEAAAAIITEYLHPENYTLFTKLPSSELIQRYKLIPLDDGEITVYQKFWDDSTCTSPHVHPIIAYAELVGSGDSRNLETAEILLNEHIRPNL